MRKRSGVVLAILVGAAMACSAAATNGAGAVADLGWLEGCWAGDDGGIAVEEHWTSAAGDALLGMHKDVEHGRMVGFEFPRIVALPPKGICYLANPNDEGVTPFCAVELTARRAVFENREHDFPQRILYWRTDDDRLHARIEGIDHGREASRDWVWSRCARR